MCTHQYSWGIAVAASMSHRLNTTVTSYIIWNYAHAWLFIASRKITVHHPLEHFFHFISDVQTSGYMNTKTHPFNRPVSRTIRVSRYQKGKNNLDFMEQTASGSGISWAVCKSAPCYRQTTTPAPHHSVFLQAGCPSCHPTNSIKALKASVHHSSKRNVHENIMHAAAHTDICTLNTYYCRWNQLKYQQT